jgi:competence protein ComEC
LRFAIAAFIAGGSFLFFLPELSLNWMLGCFLLGIIFIFLAYIGKPLSHLRRLAIVAFIFILGFAWNAHYAENRLSNILAEDLEGKDLVIEGRVAALPQGKSDGAKFAFELT